MSGFDYAFEKVVSKEGGYVNHANDLGGETKYGISKKSFPEINIEKLTLNDAREIYYQEYWLPNYYDQIESHKIASKIFDMTVNMGAKNSHMNTQRALMCCDLRIKWDGIIGPKTLAAINETGVNVLMAALKSEHANYYEKLVLRKPDQAVFIKGWLKRAYS